MKLITLPPGSPTAKHWQSDFNIFWRNLRAVYQQAALSGKPFSIFVSGVSSKWFSVESIEGIENAALALVPEEYLSPLPRGAAAAMVRRLGKLAGLSFTDDVAGLIAETCAEMPFWIRKACSYIHSKIEVGLRPFEPQADLIQGHLDDFIASDGSTMSYVALSHLFRVYPELREPTLKCFTGDGTTVPKVWVRVLEKYGIVKDTEKPAVIGSMMRNGIELVMSGENIANTIDSVVGEIQANKTDSDFGDWADEIAIISRRRNLIERKLKGICTNFIRFASLSEADKSAKERILVGLDASRRKQLNAFDADAITEKLYWLELAAIIKREWKLFERIFGDRAAFDQNVGVVNEPPDAHAKQLDAADIALQRRALVWFEDRLAKL